MADVEYSVSLDDAEILHQLRVIARAVDDTTSVMEREFTQMGRKAEQSFDKAGKQAKVSGVQIGLVSGVVQDLTRRFINMAEQAARAFVQMAAGGVQLNRELELTRISLANIFEGNEAAADAFIAITDKLAIRLRVDFQELRTIAKGILPDIGDTQQTIQLLEQFVVLGRDAGQNFTSIRIALEEAVTGQFTSLQRRLNIPLEAIRQIKERAKDIGIPAALLEVLSARVDKLGLSLDDFGDSLEAQIGAIKAEGRLLQQTFGEPIFEELKEQAAAFLDTLETKGVSIERAATAFGQLAASVVELIGSNLNDFLLALDFEQLERTADALNDLAVALDFFIKIVDAVPDANQELKDTRTIIENIQAALLTAAQAAAILKAFLAGLPALDVVASFVQFQATGDPTALFEKVNRLTKEGIVDRDAFNESIRESSKLFEQYTEKIEENRQQTEARRETVEKATAADERAGEEILRHKKRLEELAKAEGEAAEAAEKLDEKFGDAARERARELLNIQIKANRDRLEDEIKAADARLDIARKNAEKIEDILRQHNQAIADAATDLTRDEEDIARKAARRQTEQARDEANERVRIETEFRRELQRIRDRFLFDAQEAERRNDAQAFLQAVRRRDQEVNEAKRTRDENLEDASTRAGEQREKLREQLQFEIEDAKIANARKLEDLQLRLQRELDEQRIRNQRELDEQTIKEQRQAEQRARAYQQELEDFARKEGQRLADLKRSLTEEISAIQKAEALKRQIRVEEARATVEQVNAAFARLNPFSPRTPRLTQRQQVLGLQAGGDVEPGRPYIVGERGPELLVPRSAGTVVPNAAISPAMMTSISNIHNSQRSLDVGGVHVGEDMFSSPTAIRRLENVILGIMARVG